MQNLATDPFSVQGKNVVVTGAGMGIGFAIAKRFVQSGANVLLVDFDEAALLAAMDKLAPGPGKVRRLCADIGATETGAEVVRAVQTELGGIDVLVNNAGIFPSVPILRMEPDVLDRVLAVNLRGLVLLSKAVGNCMAEQRRGGAIVNIGSVDSVHPSMVGLGAYDASKGGVLSFTKNLALEMAPHNVRVNAILPGGIATEGASKPLVGTGMTPAQMQELFDNMIRTKVPMHRLGNPDEIATVALFLAAPAASYMTGSAVTVDGGMLLT